MTKTRAVSKKVESKTNFKAKPVNRRNQNQNQGDQATTSSAMPGPSVATGSKVVVSHHSHRKQPGEVSLYPGWTTLS